MIENSNYGGAARLVHGHVEGSRTGSHAREGGREGGGEGEEVGEGNSSHFGVLAICRSEREIECLLNDSQQRRK